MKNLFFVSFLIILILGLIVYPGCKTTKEGEPVYDLRGNWIITLALTGFTRTITFSGSPDNGNFTDGPASGWYQVNGTAVEWHYPQDEAVYRGNFVNPNSMEGNYQLGTLPELYPWTGNRQ